MKHPNTYIRVSDTIRAYKPPTEYPVAQVEEQKDPSPNASSSGSALGVPIVVPIVVFSPVELVLVFMVVPVLVSRSSDRMYAETLNRKRAGDFIYFNCWIFS